MEKILFVAYQFPPRGGAGVQRSLNLVRNLRAFGYDPIVLTVAEDDIRNAGYQYDESLLAMIPQGIEIVRTPSFEPVTRIKKLMRFRLYRLAWFFRYSRYWERSARWPAEVYKQAEKLVKANNIRLVYTSSGPFSSMLLGKMLKDRLGIKWVADLRDPYTDAYAWDFPSKWHWNKQRRFEEEVFTQADKLILNTPATRKLYIERGLTTDGKSICITNGF